MHLNREIITDAAIEILDTYGLADMSMRRVATHLEVAPGALYWHVKNKQALITAVATRIVEPVIVVDTPMTARELAMKLFRALLSHRDAAELVASALAQPNAPMRAEIETLLSTALGPAKHAPTAAAALVHLVVGAAVQQQNHDALVAATNAEAAPYRQDVEAQVELVLAGFSAV